MSTQRTTAPYGTWSSPLGAELVAGGTLRFGRVAVNGSRIIWSETRPAEGGRTVLVARSNDGECKDLLADGFSARSLIHEYGGGEFAMTSRGLYFVNGADQDIYRVAEGAGVHRVTALAGTRFADFCADPVRNRLIAVAECHDRDDAPVENFIAALSLDGEESRVGRFVAGADFYAYPRFSPDGRKVCWIEWNLPAMPWESAALRVAMLDQDGVLENIEMIAGGNGVAVFQPQWAADGTLYFISDESGWSNLMVWDGARCRALLSRAAEFGRPLWGLATTSYAVLASGQIAASYFEGGKNRLMAIDPASGAHNVIETGLSQIDNLCAMDETVVAIAGQDEAPPAVVAIDLDGGPRAHVRIVRRGGRSDGLDGVISRARAVSFPVGEGRNAHGLYYPPRNRIFAPPAGELPPVIVSAHGGPTGMAERGFKPKIQYWTSRGFGYFDVDYTGSYGYGRAYRDALNGAWGIADAADVAAAARWLADAGLADPGRLLISGGSAGGFTVLCALAFHDIFAAGAAYYGISDLERLAALTHKFEAGYVSTLLGLDDVDANEIYRARSPLHHAEKISAPVIFFQGGQDKVVPPDQSRAMAESLKRRGVPVAYVEFPDEGHGFRDASAITTAIESEYAFYGRILGLDGFAPLAKIDIDNLD